MFFKGEKSNYYLSMFFKREKKRVNISFPESTTTKIAKENNPFVIF